MSNSNANFFTIQIQPNNTVLQNEKEKCLKKKEALDKKHKEKKERERKERESKEELKRAIKVLLQDIFLHLSQLGN